MSGASFGRRLLLLGAALPLVWGAGAERPAREAAWRANNRGVALLEQFHYEQAVGAFQTALRLDPELAVARANLAIALLNVPKLEEARAEARGAAARLPEVPQPHYARGLAARGLAAGDEAAAAFRRVLELDPADVGSRVNLGQMLMQEQQYEAAIAELRAALAAEEHNATAAYNLGLALTRAGQVEEGRRALDRFRELREAPHATLLGQTYPEQGRYAEAIASTGAEPELVDRATPPSRFVDASERWSAVAAGRGRAARATGSPEAGGVLLFDLDGDGDLDVLALGPEGVRLYVNDDRRLVDRTQEQGLAALPGALGAAAGDVDNDGDADLLVLTERGPRILRNEGGRFADDSVPAGLPKDGAPRAAALLDADHDGDLDVFLAAAERTGPEAVGSPLPQRLLRNDGSGRLEDVAPAAGLATAAAPGAAVVATDFDNGRDVDVLVASATGPPRLFRNRRDGTFEEVAGAAGLGGAPAARGLAAGDINKDGATDFFFAAAEGPGAMAISRRAGTFVVSAAPPETAGARQAVFLDYDNDGLLDLLVATADRLRLLRGLGRSGWTDVSGPAGLAEAAPGGLAAVAAGDLDGDGDTDLVLRLAPGGLRVLENQGGAHRAIRVRLEPRVSNRSGVGAKVEMRAGSLHQRVETYASTPPVAPADVLFGLGPRAGADAVRVLWPAGILQAELLEPGAETAAVGTVAVKELDRKPSSCPYLYAWDGERFTFVTDFMGGGEMGYWQGPGQFNQPDPDEYVRLTDEQLRPRDGRLELRVTNELEEALFLDHLSLLAVDHPAEVEVYPDEGLRHPAGRFRLLAVRHVRPLAGAVDGQGRDVLDRLRRRDRRFVEGFGLHRLRGYAEEHALVLDLGADAGEESVLLLTGWTDYAFSSDNVAAHQAGLAMKPPVLQVEDESGGWATVSDTVGIPVGRPQTLLVEMSGKWRGPSRRVRLVTNMRIYWDQARVGERAAHPLEPRPLPPILAELAERGFSAEVTPDGREPFSYDYARVSWRSPWKVFPGRYTRTGDVRELLIEVDDLFVISRPGDEVALSFDGGALPALAPGQRRTYLLHADGYSKEMDINSATPHTLLPLPYHGMPSYPYGPPAAYPMTAARRAVMDRYNTRVVRAPFARLALEEKEGSEP